MKRYLLFASLLTSASCADPAYFETHVNSLTEISADALPPMPVDASLPMMDAPMMPTDAPMPMDAPPAGICGDGKVDQGEECDDGNTANDDGCNAECKYEYCGDGIVQPALGEQCDDGGYRNDDGCDMYCQIERYIPPPA